MLRMLKKENLLLHCQLSFMRYSVVYQKHVVNISRKTVVVVAFPWLVQLWFHDAKNVEGNSFGRQKRL